MAMTGSKHKLVIRTDDGIPVDDLATLLSERFDVVVDDGQDPAAAEQASIVVGAGDSSDQMAHGKAVGLLNAVGEGVCLCGPDGDLLWSNEAFDRLAGDARERVVLVCKQAASWFGQGSPAVRRVEIESDGGLVLEISLSPVRTAKDGTAQIGAVVRDVSTERRVLRKMDAIDRAGSELVRLDAEHIRKLSSYDRLKLLEDKIVRSMHDLLHFDNFAIQLLDSRSGRLEMVISQGLPAEVRDLELKPALDGYGISGHVAKTGRSYVCSDTEDDPLFLPGMTGALSSLTVPLTINDEVIGVLDIESGQRGAFSDEDRQFAEIFARHVAIALHMLDLLVIERSATNMLACGRVAGELDAPLDDILGQTDAVLQEMGDRMPPESKAHMDQIRADVKAIRDRVENVASGPQTLLGVDEAMANSAVDPLLAGKRVLIADDEAKIRRILGDVLRKRGCDVTIVQDGQAAIDLMGPIEQGELAEFDLIISDIKMPDRNGYEVFSAARRAMEDVPVILMTGFGYDPHHSIVRASQEGLQTVLFKPFPIARILEEVRKAWGIPAN